MVVLRIFTLLLALGFSAPALAFIIDADGDIVGAYEAPGVQADNNFTDYTQFMCTRDGSGNPFTDFGCVDNAGVLCTVNKTGICDTQRVPAGRCAAGSSGTCIFPLGAGSCQASGSTSYDDTKIGCLPDNVADHNQTSGSFASAVCGPGTGLCDMAGNNPLCKCQGDNPTAGFWEGLICGSDSQARCSDGDPERATLSYGGALCTSIDISLGGNNATGGRCADSNRFPGLAGSPAYGVENVPKLGTPQRRPGAGLSAPTTASRRIRITAHWKLEPYDDPNNPFFDFGIRKVKMLGNSYYQDSGWGSAQTNAANLDNTIITYLCDPPDPWMINLPLRGQCVINTSIECQRDEDCPAADTCDPASKVYCWDAARDVDGLIFTRDLSDTELADANKTGICPPDCRLDNDFNTFEQRAIINASDLGVGLDPRAGVQLALDHGVGPRAGKGDIIYVFPLTSMTWLDPDNRCYDGGDPDVVDATCSGGTCGSTTVPCGSTADCQATIGRCDNLSTACNPAAVGECGGTNDCLTCGGTWNGVFGSNPPGNPIGTPGGYSDPVNGNADAFPIGYHDPTGDLPLHTFQDRDRTRLGVISDRETTVRVPIYAVFTSGKSGSEFRDNSCDPAGRDHCNLGEVSSGGAPGIGTGGTFTTAEAPTYDPLGGNFTATSTWAADNPGVETSGDNTFLRLFDRNSGPDGVQGCLGDNLPLGSFDVPCDLQLGQIGVDGSTGSDDEPIAGDFSLAQDGSNMVIAAFARFKMTDPTRATPIFNAVSSIALEDESIAFPNNLDFINKTNSTWCPIDPNTLEVDCDRSAESFCSEFGGDTNQNQICDELEAAIDTDGDGVPNASDNCVFVPNALQTASIQDGLVGQGCSCLCGDVNNSCTVSGADVQDIQQQILPQLGVQAGCFQIGNPTDQGICNTSGVGREVRGCDVNTSGTCSAVDAQTIQLDLPQIFGTPTYPLPNGYGPTNCAQSTLDTCGEDALPCP